MRKKKNLRKRSWPVRFVPIIAEPPRRRRTRDGQARTRRRVNLVPRVFPPPNPKRHWDRGCRQVNHHNRQFDKHGPERPQTTTNNAGRNDPTSIQKIQKTTTKLTATNTGRWTAPRRYRRHKKQQQTRPDGLKSTGAQKTTNRFVAFQFGFPSPSAPRLSSILFHSQWTTGNACGGGYPLAKTFALAPVLERSEIVNSNDLTVVALSFHAG